MKLTIGVIQELKIKNGTAASIKTAQQFFPTALVFETMSKEDVGVMQRRIVVLRKLL